MCNDKRLGGKKKKHFLEELDNDSHVIEFGLLSVLGESDYCGSHNNNHDMLLFMSCDAHLFGFMSCLHPCHVIGLFPICVHLFCV